jgi:hypothetical protein
MAMRASEELTEALWASASKHEHSDECGESKTSWYALFYFSQDEWDSGVGGVDVKPHVGAIIGQTSRFKVGELFDDRAELEARWKKISAEADTDITEVADDKSASVKELPAWNFRLRNVRSLHDDGDETPEDALLGTIDIFGVSHHAWFVRVEERDDELVGVNDPYDRLEEIFSAVQGRPETVEVPGFPGRYAVLIYPYEE